MSWFSFLMILAAVGCAMGLKLVIGNYGSSQNARQRELAARLSGRERG